MERAESGERGKRKAKEEEKIERRVEVFRGAQNLRKIASRDLRLLLFLNRTSLVSLGCSIESSSV